MNDDNNDDDSVENNDDDAVEDDLEEDGIESDSQVYKDKLAEIKGYLPTLQSLIARFNNEDTPASARACVNKLSLLVETFANPRRRGLAYSCMLRVENLLKGLAKKIKNQTRKPNNSPTGRPSSPPRPSASQQPDEVNESQPSTRTETMFSSKTSQRKSSAFSTDESVQQPEPQPCTSTGGVPPKSSPAIKSCVFSIDKSFIRKPKKTDKSTSNKQKMVKINSGMSNSDVKSSSSKEEISEDKPPPKKKKRIVINEESAPVRTSWSQESANRPFPHRFQERSNKFSGSRFKEPLQGFSGPRIQESSNRFYGPRGQDFQNRFFSPRFAESTGVFPGPKSFTRPHFPFNERTSTYTHRFSERGNTAPFRYRTPSQTQSQWNSMFTGNYNQVDLRHQLEERRKSLEDNDREIRTVRSYDEEPDSDYRNYNQVDLRHQLEERRKSLEDNDREIRTVRKVSIHHNKEYDPPEVEAYSDDLDIGPIKPNYKKKNKILADIEDEWPSASSHKRKEGIKVSILHNKEYESVENESYSDDLDVDTIKPNYKKKSKKLQDIEDEWPAASSHKRKVGRKGSVLHNKEYDSPENKAYSDDLDVDTIKTNYKKKNRKLEDIEDEWPAAFSHKRKEGKHVTKFQEEKSDSTIESYYEVQNIEKKKSNYKKKRKKTEDERQDITFYKKRDGKEITSFQEEKRDFMNQSYFEDQNAEIKKSNYRRKRKITEDEWEDTSFFKIRNGPSLSSNLDFDGFGNQEANNEKDQDTINLENSQRKLEALMQNRLASINAGKISCTKSNVIDSNKTSATQTTVTAVENISSTLDEMMSNLTSKYKKNRSLLISDNRLEKDQIINTNKYGDDSEKNSKNLEQLIYKNETSKSSLLSSQMPSSHHPVSSVLKGQNKSVPSLRDEEYSVNFLTILKDDKSNPTNSKLNPQVPPVNQEMNNTMEPVATVIDFPQHHSSKPDLEENANTSDEGFLCKTKEKDQITKDLDISKAQREITTFSIQNREKQSSYHLKPNLNIETASDKSDCNELFNDKIVQDQTILNSQGKIHVEQDSSSQVMFMKSSEDLSNRESLKPNQSLRSKLSEEISTLHKVGSSYGGALRGLINRDKMMPPGRIASLKPGTLIDLIQEEKPHRHVSRNKTRQITLQPNNDVSVESNSTDVLKSTALSKECTDLKTNAIKSTDTNEILSKLSEQDLKKLINENIGDLPSPPNLSFLSNNNAICKAPDTQVLPNVNPSWNANNPAAMQQMALQVPNATVNNITLSPAVNSSLVQNQNNSLPNSWSQTNVHDSWRHISLTDPRRDSINIGIPYESGQNQNTFDTSLDQPNSPFPKYDSFMKNIGVNEAQVTGYNPSIPQVELPQYNSSSTMDLYRYDPYTMSLQENTEKDLNLFNPDITQRTLLVETPQRPPILETPLHYNNDCTQRMPLISHHDNVYSTVYSVNQQLQPGDLRSRSMVDNYGRWRSDETIVDRKLNSSHMQESSTNVYFDKSSEDQRNYSKYKWCRKDYRYRNYENQYKDHNTSRPVINESDIPRKLSSRDPRRKSFEENSGKVDAKRTVSNHEPSRQDLRVRENVSRSQHRSYYDERFSNKVRREHTSNKEKVQYRKEDSMRTDTRRQKPSNRDTYSSPLDKLYSNMDTPKTGLGYGLQKFRIPKMNRSTSIQPLKQNAKEKNQNCSPISTITEASTMNNEENNMNSQGLLEQSKNKIDLINDSLEEKSAHGNLKEVNNENIDVEESYNNKFTSRSNFKLDKSSKQKSQVEDHQTIESHSEEMENEDVCKKRRSQRLKQSQSQKSDTLSEKDQFENITTCVSDQEKIDERESEAENRLITNTNKSLNLSLCDREDIKGNSDGDKDPLNNCTKSYPETTDQIYLKTNICEKVEKEFLSDQINGCTVLTEDEAMTPTDKKDNKSLENTFLSDSNKIVWNQKNIQYNITNNDPEHAIDLSVKKITTDKSLLRVHPGEKKNINNPPIIASHSTQSFDGGILFEKTASKSEQIVEFPSQKQNAPIVDPQSKLKLIENVLGGKLTPDKIMKVAEFLKGIEFKEIEDVPVSKSENDSCIDEIAQNEKSNEDEKNNDSGKNEYDPSKSIKQTGYKNDIENQNQVPSKGCKSNNKSKKIKKQANQLYKESENNIPAKQKKRKYKNELDRLQDDISKYHDSEAIAAASGMRMCRLQKELKSKINNTTQPIQGNKKKNLERKNDNSKETTDQTTNLNKSESDQSDSDESDSDDSDEWNLLSEKLKLKYGHLITNDQEKVKQNQSEQEEKKQESKNTFNLEFMDKRSNEIPTHKNIDISEPSLGKNTIDQSVVEFDNKGVNPVKIGIHHVDSKSESSDFSSQISCLKENDSSSSINKRKDNEPCNKEMLKSVKFSGRSISDNILNKYKIRKQKKKCRWYAGVIKKKTKPKKSVYLLSPEISHIEKCENSVENCENLQDSSEIDKTLGITNSEDLMILEPPDLNYYQEGESKSTKCKLCSFLGKAIVSHYAITHPKDEVLISRMSPLAAQTAITESNIFFTLPEERKQQLNKFQCRVCNQEFMKFSMFFEHMALHTGEFRHECCKCGYRTSTRSGIIKHHLSHPQSSKNDTKTSCRVLYKEPTDQSNFFGYLCSMCNFFQIHYVSVKRHIENSHNVQDLTKIIKIIFSKLPYTDVESATTNVVQAINQKETFKETAEEIKSDTSCEEIVSKEMDYEILKKKEVQTNEEEIHINDTHSEQTTRIDNNDCVSNISSGELNILSNDLVVGEILKEDKTEVSSLEGEILKEDKTEVSSQESVCEFNNLRTDDKSALEEETREQPEKGYFEISSDVNDYSQIADEEVLSTYKKKCDETMCIINLSNKTNRTHKLCYLEKISLKQNKEDDNIAKQHSLQNLLSYKKIIKDNPIAVTDKPVEIEDPGKIDGETAPIRRQLPDRTCKSLNNCYESDSEEDNLAEFFELIDDVEVDSSKEALSEHKFDENLIITNAPVLFENQIKRCRELMANRKTYLPKVCYYSSSLPVNSNLSEFTHVMKQISQFTLKPTDSKEIVVGGLKLNQNSNSVLFSCSIKVFNKSCQFQTISLEEFGQHVNMSHHTTYWDGTCGACFIVFNQDTSSHDKTTLYSQSRAFCHLVREHLTFVKKSKSEVKGSSSSNAAVQSKPKLRVRRLSGDKLSHSGPGTENILTQPQKEVTGPVLNAEELLAKDTNQRSFVNKDGKVEIINISEVSRLSSLTSAQLPHLGTEKNYAVYQNMLSFEKLKHLYKCMGANCSYTTMSPKDFTYHFDQHKEIHSLSPDEDPHRGFWRYCSYCTTCHESSKELLVHIRKEHAECLLQCAYCFYRSKSIANVHFHHANDHQLGSAFLVLQCEQKEMNLPPMIEKPFTEFVSGLRCNKDNCSLLTYMLDVFCKHLINVHHGVNVSCHICLKDYPSVVTLLKHYKESHGIGLYQCLYCVFGTSTEHEIRVHLCYKHPSFPPKAIHRTDSKLKSTVGTQKRESLKRIVFCKDEDQLLKHVVPSLPGDGENILDPAFDSPLSETSPIKQENVIPSSTGSPHRPVIFRGINSNPEKTASTSTDSQQNIVIMSTESSPSLAPVKLICLNPTLPIKSSSLPTSVMNTVTLSTGTQVISPSSPYKVIVPDGSAVHHGTTTPSISGFQRRSVITSPAITLVTTSLFSMPTTTMAIGRPILMSSTLPITLDSTSVVSSITASASTSNTTSTSSEICETTPQRSEDSTSVVSSVTASASTSNPTSTCSEICETTPQRSEDSTSVVSSVTASASTINPTSTSSEICETNPQRSEESTSVDSSASVSNSTNTCSATSEITPQRSEDSSSEETEEKYFKCGNIGCNFESSTSAPLKCHLVICDHARQSERLVCVFCKRLFKQAVSLIHHLRIHGPQRFLCALCDHKAPVQSRISAHMRASHNITSTILVPLNSLKQDVEKDLFVVTPKERQTRTLGKSSSKLKKSDGPKLRFCLEELEEIPTTAIFQLALGCSLCDYKTKVRSNLIRHIAQHSTGQNVSQEEVVNPVPEKTEKMFDKMMNLAGSSHKKKILQDEDMSAPGDIECQYKYVPDQLRYMCHLKDCSYQTVSESMLKFHISVIHKDETLYVCPHCIETTEPVPIDQLGLHLKLHDSPLYKCPHCSYFSHIKRTIEKHQLESHPDEKGSVLVVRIAKPANEPEEPVAKPLLLADVPDGQGEEWLSCTLCNFKTKKRKVMLSHGTTEHKMAKPFRCSMCNYENMTAHLLKSHFKACHPNEESCEIITLYEKVIETKKPIPAPIPPLWKRDNKRIKLIRGIKLDEKGDAPPPVATCTNMDISSLDILELKYGSFGRPSHDGRFQCPRCPTFQVKNRQEMREHLFKDLEYKPYTCITCKFSTTQKPKVLKHISRVHNVSSERYSTLVETNSNQDIEDWVDKVLTTQSDTVLQRDLSGTSETEEAPVKNTIVGGRNRRRSSAESVNEIQTPVESVLPSSSAPLPPPARPCPSSTDVSLCTSGDKDVSKNDSKKRKRDKSVSGHRFGCNYCSVTTKYKHSIVQHVKKTHTDLPVNIVSLPRNVAERADCEAYSCMHCNCISLKMLDLKHHYTTTHKQSGVLFKFTKLNVLCQPVYECYWCKTRNNTRNLQDHCRQEHHDRRFLMSSLINPKYRCSQCDVVVDKLSILKIHFMTDHPTQQFCYFIVQSREAVTGDILGESTSTSSLKHDEMYNCYTCPYVCRQYWPLVRHLSTHLATYACPECNSVHTSTFHTKIHMIEKHSYNSETMKPVVLMPEKKEMETALRKICILSSHTGEKRQITEEELTKAKREDKNSSQDLEMYSYDEPLQVDIGKPLVKETARKSTSGFKKKTAPTSPPDAIVNLSKQSKSKKLHSDGLQKPLNIKAKPIMDDATSQEI